MERVGEETVPDESTYSMHVLISHYPPHNTHTPPLTTLPLLTLLPSSLHEQVLKVGNKVLPRYERVLPGRDGRKAVDRKADVHQMTNTSILSADQEKTGTCTNLYMYM